MDDIIKLRNEIISIIDECSIASRSDDEYFCASVEYTKYEYHEVLEVNFYTRNDNTVFYTFDHDFDKEEIAVDRRYENEETRTNIIFSEAIEDLKNKFRKLGVKLT